MFLARRKQHNYLENYCLIYLEYLFLNFINSSWKNPSVQVFPIRNFPYNFHRWNARKSNPRTTFIYNKKWYVVFYFVCASCPLASASQTVFKVTFSAHFIIKCSSFGELKFKKRFDFHRQKIVFIIYEPYEKIMNANLIPFTKMYGIYFFISEISSFNFCYAFTHLVNNFQRFRAQVPLLPPSAQFILSCRYCCVLFCFRLFWQRIF